jgi:penicillin-binding protein 2
MNHEVYAGQAEQNRIRILPIPARRGAIYDRHGKVLVDSRSSFNIVVSRKDVKSLTEFTDLLVDSLQIDRTWLEKRFDDARFEHATSRSFQAGIGSGCLVGQSASI